MNTHKIVQLSGKDSQCGKSWLALKLVDYINYPKDEEFKEYNLLECIECGSCQFVCPSKRPLTEGIRIGKAKLRSMETKN